MPLTDPMDIPSLDRVFGHSTHLMRAFENANITSTVSVMLLPKQVLMEFNGIGARTASLIHHELTRRGLGHHSFNEKLADFVTDQFGRIEDAPLAVLNVVTMRDHEMTRPYYMPLQLLRLMERLEPHLTLGKVMGFGSRDFLGMVEEHVVFGPLLLHLLDDAEHLTWRLEQWRQHLRTNQPLSLVSSQ